MRLNWNGRNYKPLGNHVRVYKPDINELIKPLSQKPGLGSAILTGSFISGIGDNYPEPSPTIPVTPSVTPTNTATNTPTPTPTVTPTNTATNTPTPSVTPTEPYDVYEFEECNNPSNVFRYENVPGTLSVGTTYEISGGTGFTGFATVITYTGAGPLYTSSGVTFTVSVCPSPTPTPSVTPTETPTNTPSVTPTETPTVTPTETPTQTPSSTSPTQLLLDLYPNAAFGVSVRKLRNAYTGAALRVRRSNDNAEQDIGFSGNNLDTTALTTFVGANNGFVVTWYDQSGNNKDFSQATLAAQPQIVSGGTILTTTGIGTANPSIRFTGSGGSGQFLSGGTLSGYSSASIFSSLISTSSGGNGFWNFNNDDGGASHHPFTPTDAYEGAFKTNRPLVTVPSSSLTSLHIWGITSAANDYKVSLNSTNSLTQTASTVQTSVTSANIGKASGNAFYSGSFQEVVSWFSNQDSNRTGIVNNLNDYFDVF